MGVCFAPIFPFVKREKVELMRLNETDRRVMDFFWSQPDAEAVTTAAVNAARGLNISTHEVTISVRRLIRKGVLRRQLRVCDPQEQWTYLVTLVPQGPGPTDLNFFRQMRTDDVRVEEAWHNSSGSMAKDGRWADGYTLLIRAKKEITDSFGPFRDRLTDAALKAGYMFSKIHCIPLQA